MLKSITVGDFLAEIVVREQGYVVRLYKYGFICAIWPAADHWLNEPFVEGLRDGLRTFLNRHDRRLWNLVRNEIDEFPNKNPAQSYVPTAE